MAKTYNEDQLFHENVEALSDYCAYPLQHKLQVSNTTEPEVTNLCLFLLQKKSHSWGKTLAQVGLKMQYVPDHQNTLTDNVDKIHKLNNPKKDKLCQANLASQKCQIFNVIMNQLEHNLQVLPYIYGPGESGKTFLLN
ncbi:hypothetical protein O181_086834 [Austropuccinia psidii MF-1]|uniref:Uncharacterized protein n=1 Tax=Austropuccinia psidii MF-1 TaxID=1389203 RepID=A0A9Q3INJ8_9BASI|nr:hypothetical protein [Austropuccinia psidii MF-1]